jgi:glycosyltransferase involved in cell wall biosynthesis
LFAQPHPRDVTLGSPKSVMRLVPHLEASGNQVSYFFLEDVPETLRKPRLLYVAFPLLLARRVASGKFDVVDIASGDAFVVGGTRRLPTYGHPPVVSRVLGMEHIHWAELKSSVRRGEEHLSWYHRVWFGGLRLSQVEWSIRLANHALCLCQQDKRHIVSHGWRGAQSVSVIAPGVDRLYLEAEPAGLESTSILFLGTWTSRKGIRDLVQAFERVYACKPETRLVIAGARTPTERVLSSFSAASRGAVEVLPTMSEAELLRRMQGCALMVFPSLYEGFGIAFLEAMAVGLPVVTTRTGGMADIIEPGVNGELVGVRKPAALAETILGLLGDPARRRRLGTAARQTASRYTWQRAASDTNRLYQCLVCTPSQTT